ncbi:hypothetical protein E2C01_038893 [Portunus trituberculatus]|uniref:Uncharacterized protein n=1 Tax=Portunus trituberculatus TaxID=210409 RepID=A0A5B7FDC0_PORTR|nr:hypothetical protein [Portunus trituberculatus]
MGFLPIPPPPPANPFPQTPPPPPPALLFTTAAMISVPPHTSNGNTRHVGPSPCMNTHFVVATCWTPPTCFPASLPPCNPPKPRLSPDSTHFPPASLLPQTKALPTFIRYISLTLSVLGCIFWTAKRHHSDQAEHTPLKREGKSCLGNNCSRRNDQKGKEPAKGKRKEER